MDRRAARRQYKETQQPAGVFKITNQKNGKIFLDKTPNLRGRENRFRMEFKTGSLRQPTGLVNDLRAQGPDDFTFEVLEVLEVSDAPGADLESELEALLELWLEKLEPFNERGYN